MLLLSRVSPWVLKQEATMSAVVALLAAGSRAHSTTSFVGPPTLRGMLEKAPEEHHPASFSLRSKIGDGRGSCAALRLKVRSSPLQLHGVEGLFSPSTVSRSQSRRWSRASPTLASIRSAVDGAACEDRDDAGGMPSGRSSIRRGDGAPRDASRRSRERELFARSTSGGEPPPLQDELWSKQSVFEFKSLNDPSTNTAFYQESCRGGDDPRASPSQRPAAEPRVAVFDEEALIPLGIDDPSSEASANDWLRFREKEALSRSKEATKERATPGGKVRGVHGPATVELATQLGLPASATYDELRSAYRVEIKRCHPDAAGADANEFRVKALERRFVRLTTSWEKFVNARQNPSSRERSSQGSPTDYSEESASHSAAQANSERRRAPRQRRRRQPMDEGREILDVGGSSC